MAYITVGNAVAEWDDNEPFIFTMSEEVGVKDDRRTKTISIDLTSLRSGFEDEFLLHVKDILIERKHKVVLRTIDKDYAILKRLLRRIIDHGLFDTKVACIDESFLLAFNTIKDSLPSSEWGYLKRIFNACPHSPLFAQDLREGDFPQNSDKKGSHGQRIDNILAKALTRAACAEILTRCEQAYEDGKMDIGRFSFINLAFSVYARTESYRQIRLEDFVYDTKRGSFFLYITPVKSGVHQPRKICYGINKHVGVLLQKQRQHVEKTYGHLVNPNDIGKIAMFPASQLTSNNSRWLSSYANESFGRLSSGGSFSSIYFGSIKTIVKESNFNLGTNVLRHTVGTQMAQAGCSARTIANALKHATNQACDAYVDIAFHGLINELSDTMRPAFEAHMPVFQRFRAKGDSIQEDKEIISEDIESGLTELTGECGKQIRCQAAPFTCYECNKFTPCWDADHSLNLGIIKREMEVYKNAGTAYRQMVEKYRAIKIRIQLVMAACDRYMQAVADQEEHT